MLMLGNDNAKECYCKTQLAILMLGNANAK